MRAIERVVAGGGENITHATSAVESCGVYDFEPFLLRVKIGQLRTRHTRWPMPTNKAPQKDWLLLVFTH